MSMVPITAATSAAGAAAAKRHQEMLRREEEEMTAYRSDDLEGWEFKIVRVATRKFKDPTFVRRVCEEESRAGWEMLEKFDDYRIRFKRPVEKRADDPHLDIDPYRTQVGISGNQMELRVAGAIVAGLGVAGLIAFLLYQLARH